MRVVCVSMLAVLAAVTLMGSILAATLQQVLAIQDSEKIAFKKLTNDFEKAVINAIGNPDVSPGPRELLSAYVEDVTRIFLGGPDTIPVLLGDYQQKVLSLLSAPPEPEKQAQHDQIKEFRQLTNAFEKAVIGASAPPEPE